MPKAAYKPYLSKSKLIAAWQCLKRLHLEKHHPELGHVSAQTQAAFKIGHDVGAIAQKLYGTEDSVEIPFNRNMSVMLAETAALIEQSVDFPIFEATFQHDGILIRVDVLIREEDGWRAIEVKGSTSAKDVYVLDCAIQNWVMKGVGLTVNSIAISHINNQFIYAGDGDYSGLLIETDVTERVNALEPAVLELIDDAREAVVGDLPEILIGKRCNDPYACQFISHCWALDDQYPTIGIGGTKKDIHDWVNRGFKSISDIPEDEISGDKRERIYRLTRAGAPEVLEGAKTILEALPYPRYYLDFETAGPSIPVWAGTQPYKHVPIQYSCHIDDGTSDGSPENMRHEEFLDLSGDAPMRALAEHLIACLGDTGVVFMYTNYEERQIRELVDRFPDLAAPLIEIIERLFDLCKLAEDHYYHPGMLGSWSIKTVAPAIAPHMNYANLDGINEGMAAANGYLEAIHPKTTPDRKTQLEQELLRYCRFDTEAMVEIVRFFECAN